MKMVLIVDFNNSRQIIRFSKQVSCLSACFTTSFKALVMIYIYNKINYLRKNKYVVIKLPKSCHRHLKQAVQNMWQREVKCLD